MTNKIQALVACQTDDCAEDSYPLDMVRMWEGKPICQECYLAHMMWVKPSLAEMEAHWDSLPPVRLEDLKA